MSYSVECADFPFTLYHHSYCTCQQVLQTSVPTRWDSHNPDLRNLTCSGNLVSLRHYHLPRNQTLLEYRHLGIPCPCLHRPDDCWWSHQFLGGLWRWNLKAAPSASGQQNQMWKDVRHRLACVGDLDRILSDPPHLIKCMLDLHHNTVLHKTPHITYVYFITLSSYFVNFFIFYISWQMCGSDLDKNSIKSTIYVYIFGLHYTGVLLSITAQL